MWGILPRSLSTLVPRSAINNLNALVLSFPYDVSVFGSGMVNEGHASIMTGMKGIPALSEYATVKRNLDLVPILKRWTEIIISRRMYGHIHVS